jgi:hypothetical protein
MLNLRPDPFRVQASLQLYFVMGNQVEAKKKNDCVGVLNHLTPERTDRKKFSAANLREFEFFKLFAQFA